LRLQGSAAGRRVDAEERDPRHGDEGAGAGQTTGKQSTRRAKAIQGVSRRAGSGSDQRDSQ
jgi:hypothetical protein